KLLRVINTENKIIAEDLIVADSFITRLKGLMFKKNFNKGEALIIKPCSSIHTFNMKFSIDVVFISKDNNVLYTIENLKPNRVSPIIRKSYSVLELPAGTIKETNIKIGNKILIKD
ncbi:DUF192 domain-containing protein, partial [Romboutsia sp.]|uniref:DUF192 domain-containing protein n=1 Tax=Romboutsia sp. TaxID=1965302 RepID=UPI002BF1B985